MMKDTGLFPDNCIWVHEKQMYVIPWQDCDSWVFNMELHLEYVEWLQHIGNCFPFVTDEDDLLDIIVEEQLKASV